MAQAFDAGMRCEKRRRIDRTAGTDGTLFVVTIAGNATKLLNFRQLAWP